MVKKNFIGVLLCSISLGLLAIVGWIMLDRPTSTPTRQTAVSAQTPTTLSAKQTTVMPVMYQGDNKTETLPALPSSLQGTQVDGEIIIDEHKQLVVTPGLRRLFDYFLTAQGEEPISIIHQRVQRYIQTHTPEPAASQALAIYRQYINYLQALSQIDTSVAHQPQTDQAVAQLDLALINQQQQAVKALRSKMFDATTRQAFFGSEEALSDYNLSVIQANQNRNLTPQVRQSIIEDAKQRYTNSFSDSNVREQLQQQANIETLLEQTNRLKQQGASQAQLDAMRRQYVDEGAVQRLQQLDQNEAAFTARVANFVKQRAQIQANQPSEQAQHQINALKNQLFSANEQLRLHAVEVTQNRTKF